MTDSQQPADRPLQPAAGYYPDPAAGPVRRWWDGYNWTDAYEPGQYSIPVDANGRPVQPPLPEGTKFDTALIWAFALLPLVSMASFSFYDFAGAMRAQLENPQDPFAVYTPGYFLAQFIGFALYAASVLLAFFDHRALARAGVVRPFHWAWTFLSGLVYIIGRTVVLRRRVGKGMGPLWLYIGLSVIATIVIFAVIFSGIATAFSEIGFRTAP